MVNQSHVTLYFCVIRSKMAEGRSVAATLPLSPCLHPTLHFLAQKRHLKTAFLAQGLLRSMLLT